MELISFYFLKIYSVGNLSKQENFGLASYGKLFNLIFCIFKKIFVVIVLELYFFLYCVCVVQYYHKPQ